MIGEVDSLYLNTRPRKALVRWISHLFFQGRFATTNYRQLNQFILLHLRLARRLPALRPVTKPIFIVGTGRSGSTILGKVLSIHREIAFLNEPKAMWYSIDRREDVNGHFGEGHAKYRFDESDVTPEVLRRAHSLFGYYLTLTCSRRLLDKNPEMVFRIPYVRALFPDARFILLVRNGWDTIHSIATWSSNYRKGTGDASEDWWGVNRKKWRVLSSELLKDEPRLSEIGNIIYSTDDERQMAAVEWVLTMKEGIRQLNRYPDHIALLRYEDLTQCPKESLERLSAFCDLPHDGVVAQYAQSVLKANRSRDPIPLQPILKDVFDATMRTLGYPVK